MESPHNERETKPRKPLEGLSGLRESVFRGLDVATHHCFRLLLLSKGSSDSTLRSSACCATNDISTITSCLSLMDKDAPPSFIIPAIFLGVPVFVLPVYNNKLTNLTTTALLGKISPRLFVSEILQLAISVLIWSNSTLKPVLWKIVNRKQIYTSVSLVMKIRSEIDLLRCEMQMHSETVTCTIRVNLNGVKLI